VATLEWASDPLGVSFLTFLLDLWWLVRSNKVFTHPPEGVGSIKQPTNYPTGTILFLVFRQYEFGMCQPGLACVLFGLMKQRQSWLLASVMACWLVLQVVESLYGTLTREAKCAASKHTKKGKSWNIKRYHSVNNGVKADKYISSDLWCFLIALLLLNGSVLLAFFVINAEFIFKLDSKRKARFITCLLYWSIVWMLN